ncbi:MAG: hypothetical protein IT372_40065 [Polyangiaceae bacterium]|nr:hypothetical protein [Polyangiaceae bacterium]
MEITTPRTWLRRILLAAMALVTGAGLLVELLRVPLDLRTRRGALPLLSLSYEGNVPTWYSSALLLVCALLLAVIAAGALRSEAPYRRHWGLLSAIFLYISMDETASIHEGASGWIRLSGVLYYSWVIPAGSIVAALGVSYLGFLWHLPRRTRIQFIAAGAIYVTGALVMELPLGYWTEQHGTDNLGYAVIDWAEEALEILGVTLFLLSLADHLGAQGFRLGFAAAPVEPLPGPVSPPPGGEEA